MYDSNQAEVCHEGTLQLAMLSEVLAANFEDTTAKFEKKILTW